jgi:hypothetical protein
MHVTTPLTNASSKSSVSRVLVVAYYRSGSSWLGEALALPDDAFYLFEPYHALYSAWYSAPGHTEVRYTLGGGERFVNLLFDFHNDYTLILMLILSIFLAQIQFPDLEHSI